MFYDFNAASIIVTIYRIKSTYTSIRFFLFPFFFYGKRKDKARKKDPKIQDDGISCQNNPLR